MTFPTIHSSQSLQATYDRSFKREIDLCHLRQMAHLDGQEQAMRDIEDLQKGFKELKIKVIKTAKKAKFSLRKRKPHPNHFSFPTEICGAKVNTAALRLPTIHKSKTVS